jgi:signal recognition particle subunit SRP54
MFDSLTDKLQQTFKTLRGHGSLNEGQVKDGLREIRLALLEADVNFKVVKDLLGRIREKATGQDVLSSLTPGQQVVKIVRDELVELLGASASKLKFHSNPPTVILMVGLQGSGKTTSTGKIGRWLREQGKSPYLVPVDVYRPAAIEQLQVVGRAVGLPVHPSDSGDDPVDISTAALTEARKGGYDVVIVDTAGRLHIDENLMEELARLKEKLVPTEILFVADAMTGQDAVKSAGEFHEQLGITGVVLSKMDGDARGGAAISVRAVTGQPIKFVGTGEKYEDLELFHPERMASRILGMGDVLSLIEKAELGVDADEAVSLQKKLKRDAFDLEDFQQQLRRVRKMGPLSQIMKMIPGMGQLKDMGDMEMEEKELVKIDAIISSMTRKERTNPSVLNGSRRKRIARGSGTTVQDVNRLVKQFSQTKKMLRSMTAAGGKRKMPGGLKIPFS